MKYQVVLEIENHEVVQEINDIKSDIKETLHDFTDYEVLEIRVTQL